MKLSRRAYMILSIFVLVATIAIVTYVKSNSILAENKLENNTKIAANKNTKQLENKHIIEKQQKLEEQKKLEKQKKLGKEKKLDQKKLEYQKKLEAQVEQQKQEATEASKKQEAAEASKKQEASSKNETSSSKKAAVVVPPTDTKPKTNFLIDRIKGKGNAKQAIIITTNDFGNVNSTITAFEKVNGNWKQIDSFAGNIGKAGFAYAKAEGDGHSPIGIFTLGTTFGRYSNPGTAMEYRQSTLNDFWVDDINSSLYNTWQQGPVNGRWESAEKMYIPQYNYGFVINYNTAEKTPGRGSAIFFHVWSGAGSGTAGCTAAAQENVISTLKWLNPSKNPIIIEGPISEVEKM